MGNPASTIKSLLLKPKQAGVKGVETKALLTGMGTLLPFVFLAVAMLAGACSHDILSLETQTKTVGLHIQSFCPDSGYTYSQIYANNQSAILTTTGWTKSTNRDFLSDDFKNDPTIKANFGFNPNSGDSIQAGYRDGVLYKLGYNIASGQNVPVCNNPYVDTDNDGLWDCEENLISTDLANPDDDGDGIPDGVEFRNGLNPKSAADAQIESTAPGVTNLMAAVTHLLINTTPTDFLMSLRYTYEVTNLSGGCYSFKVTNIPVMDVANGNMLEILVLENAINGTARVKFERILVPKETTDRKVIVVPAISNTVMDPVSTPYTYE